MRKTAAVAALFLGIVCGAACGPLVVKIGTLPKKDHCIAVVPFETRYESASQSEMLSELVALELFSRGAHGVIGPHEVSKLFREANDPLPVAIDPYWARRVGQRLGVDAVLFGSLVRVPIIYGEEQESEEVHLNFDAFLLDVETGYIRWVYGAKELIGENDYMTHLSRHAEFMASNLLAHFPEKVVFGERNCWKTPKREALAGERRPPSAAAMPTPAPTPAPPLTESQKMVLDAILLSSGFTLSSPVFEGRGEQIAKDARGTLKDVAAALLSPRAPKRVEILGHVDATDDVAGDLALSKNRAEAVRAYLEILGVPKERLQASGVGGNQPLVPNINERSREMNRRVELKKVEVPAR